MATLDYWQHSIRGELTLRYMMKIFKCIKNGFLRNERPPFVIYPKFAGQCGRCQMIGVDQKTGTKTKELLMSLAAYRNGKVSQKQLLPVHVDQILNLLCPGATLAKLTQAINTRIDTMPIPDK